MTDLGVSGKAAAVVSSVPQEPTGINRRGKIWFVSTPAGATWVTNIDVTAANDESGLVVPLNGRARSASEMGVDLPPDVLANKGITDGRPEAEQSRMCAKAL